MRCNLRNVCTATVLAAMTWTFCRRHTREEPKLEDCLVLVHTESFPEQYYCQVGEDEFPIAVANRSRPASKPKNIRFRSAFLHVTTILSQDDIYQSLQYLAEVSSFSSVLLTMKDGNYVEQLEEDLLKKDRGTSVIFEHIGSLAWWGYVLNSSGLHVSKVIWKDDRSQVLIRVQGGVQYDPCNCVNELPQIRKHIEKYPSCAVVMNSGLLGNMTQPRLGVAIDAHTAVFRMNEGPAGGLYGAIAGSKTTFRIIYPYPKTMQPFNGETLLFSVHYKSERRMIDAAIRAQNFLPHQRLVEIPKKFRNCVKKCMKLPKRHPSTGVMSVVLAISLCDRVTVFGKSLTADSLDTSKFAYHYFEDNTLGKTSEELFSPFHRPDLEKALYTLLSNFGVTFVP